MKRVFLIVLDSVGIGEAPDAALFGDEGSNTLRSASRSPYFSMDNMARLGLFQIDGVSWGPQVEAPLGAVARLQELSAGKDTTIGHWELAGLVSEKPLPTYPNGFPKEVLDAFEKAVGRGVLCNRPYSGTKVIEDYGEQHLRTGDLIVYTSADSVFQIAAHEELVPPSLLYEYCEKARAILTGEHGVGRVIARPFVGRPGQFSRTANRHDFSLLPPAKTMLNVLSEAGFAVKAVGKIHDIFAGSGVTESVRTSGNAEGIERTLEYMDQEFEGLCFTNLVDYDMLYGHRNDVDGYARALTYFDQQLPRLMEKLGPEDLLFITADHGCDPGTASTDHSREYVPLVMYGQPIHNRGSLGTRKGFCHVAATILDYFGLPWNGTGSPLPL